MNDEKLCEESNRAFRGVWIPKEVWLDTRLNALEKIILTEIDSLDQGEQGCYASNKHIAEFCQCSEAKVSKAVSKLIGLGYLQLQKFDGRQRELKSCLVFFTRQTDKKYQAASEKIQESNTVSNTESKKKESKSHNGYEKIISEYTENEELRTALVEFIKMRKLIKKPMTDRALKGIISKLDKIGHSDQEKIAILDQSISNSWQGIFELKPQNKQALQQEDTGHRTVDWDNLPF